METFAATCLTVRSEEVRGWRPSPPAVVNVAGGPALLVAKAFKIRDRAAGGARRMSNKDALDVYRLMVTTDAGAVADSLVTLAKSDRVGTVAREGTALLRALFGAPRTVAVDMAVEALAGSVREERVRQLMPAFVAELPVFQRDSVDR